jgi:hypothetical protein
LRDSAPRPRPWLPSGAWRSLLRARDVALAAMDVRTRASGCAGARRAGREPDSRLAGVARPCLDRLSARAPSSQAVVSNRESHERHELSPLTRYAACRTPEKCGSDHQLSQFSPSSRVHRTWSQRRTHHPRKLARTPPSVMYAGTPAIRSTATGSVRPRVVMRVTVRTTRMTRTNTARRTRTRSTGAGPGSAPRWVTRCGLSIALMGHGPETLSGIWR